MLAHTRLDVRGEGLRLPFDSFALMFTDRETLTIGEALATRDRQSNIRGLTVRSMTVYVARIPPTRGALGLHLSILLDANTGEWPWILRAISTSVPTTCSTKFSPAGFPM